MNPRIALIERAAEITENESFYTCWLCKLPITMDAGSHHRKLARTKDHVIPKSRKRRGSINIIRYAHAYCNWIRSDSLEITEKFEEECRAEIRRLEALRELWPCACKPPDKSSQTC